MALSKKTRRSYHTGTLRLAKAMLTEQDRNNIQEMNEDTIKQPLKGLKIVVTGQELQNIEHRGIAMYTKSVLRALADAGADLWLLTDFNIKQPKNKPNEKNLHNAWKHIYQMQILDALDQGESLSARRQRISITRKSGKAAWAIWWIILHVKWRVKRICYKLSEASIIDLKNIVDNPYARSMRLSYIDHLSGLLNIPNIFFNSNLASYSNIDAMIDVTLGCFDAIVTTAPLNMAFRFGGSVFQTIHDLIPLEYSPKSRHAKSFCRKLEKCLQSNQLFVSTSSLLKYNEIYGNLNRSTQEVILQPPSLRVRQPKQYQEMNASAINMISDDKTYCSSALEPFKYILFNSSIEPRKNVLFLIQAYRASGLAQSGIKLCITGQLKNDTYSRNVEREADKSVMLTGYIDENSKTSLFLHALMVVSPSLVEGFGIPVLDAACVGAPVIASPSASHQEIRELHDFKRFVSICDTRDTLQWAIKMKDIASIEQEQTLHLNQKLQQREERYLIFEQTIFREFQQKLCGQVLNNIKSKMVDACVRG